MKLCSCWFAIVSLGLEENVVSREPRTFRAPCCLSDLAAFRAHLNSVLAGGVWKPGPFPCFSECQSRTGSQSHVSVTRVGGPPLPHRCKTSHGRTFASRVALTSPRRVPGRRERAPPRQGKSSPCQCVRPASCPVFSSQRYYGSSASGTARFSAPARRGRASQNRAARWQPVPAA